VHAWTFDQRPHQRTARRFGRFRRFTHAVSARFEISTVRVSPTRSARVVMTEGPVGGDELVAALGLPPPRGLLVLNGSTTPLDHSPHAQRKDFARGLAAFVAVETLTVVTGGTAAGMFALLGEAVGEPTAPLVGVAPAGAVTWYGAPPRPSPEPEPPEPEDAVALEPHHTHFVLVQGQQWGDETPAMLALAGALGRSGGSVAMLYGGGAISRRETLGHVRAGRPVCVIEGSGRLADELVAVLRGAAPGDDLMEEIVATGDVRIVNVAASAGALAEVLRAALRGGAAA
jgi:hypothetical protein